MSADLCDLAGRPVIIGGGIAGLMAALHLAPEPVLLLSRSPPGADASSAWARATAFAKRRGSHFRADFPLHASVARCSEITLEAALAAARELEHSPALESIT